MTGSTTDARKRAADSGDPYANVRTAAPPPTVPRVARTVDDLAVGMVVAIHNEWDHAVYRIESIQDSRFGAYCLHPKDTDEKGRQHLYDFLVGTKDDGPGYITGLVILADAPRAPGWVVPADTMAALREANAAIAGLSDQHGGRVTRVVRAARAVLDAAREVER